MWLSAWSSGLLLLHSFCICLHKSRQGHEANVNCCETMEMCQQLGLQGTRQKEVKNFEKKVHCQRYILLTCVCSTKAVVVAVPLYFAQETVDLAVALVLILAFFLKSRWEAWGHWPLLYTDLLIPAQHICLLLDPIKRHSLLFCSDQFESVTFLPDPAKTVGFFDFSI